MPFDPTRDVPERDIRRWAMFAHLGGLAVYVLPVLPVLGIAVPAMVWLARRDLHPYIDRQGTEAINFQITIVLYGLALGCVAWLLLVLPFGLRIWPVGTVWMIGHIGGTVVGAVRAMDGEEFRYPLTLRFVSPKQPA